MVNSTRDIQSVSARPEQEETAFHVLFFVVPGFSLMALSSAIEPLRAVNRLTGEDRYVWSVAADTVGQVAASNGLEVSATADAAHFPRADLTVVVASYDAERYFNPALFRSLRRLRAERRQIGAVSNGTLLLARAGVLSGRRVTIHWETQRLLAEEFPDLDVSADIYCSDKGVLTAAGGTASMDMMLALIAGREGAEMAADVSDQFLHGPVRPSTEMQRQDVRWRFQTADRRIVTAIRAMEEHKPDPLKIGQVAGIAGVSERQLERLFLSEFGKSPSDFYLELRLKAAEKWLLNSTESLEEISEKLGFSSLSHFSRRFKGWAGESPSAVRRRHRDKIVGKMQNIGGPL
ncbi:GlxA family transcriptional regulator [Leisingera sp. D0M16]|uniref:GlxA family transcriptional regulator n=1 Tax=Leisingera coralii TaxID=3351347 RepID=UPI003B7ADAA2